MGKKVWHGRRRDIDVNNIFLLGRKERKWKKEKALDESWVKIEMAIKYFLSDVTIYDDD